MDEKQTIIEFLRARGPSVPTIIGRQIQRDSFFTMAHLSELKAAGKIKISYLKIGGGSPLYYLPGQEAMLQNFAGNLGDKEKKVYELLRDKKVIRDGSLVPVFRAAIRTIRDFAFPLGVKLRDQKELFWKWYLLPNNETNELLKNMLGVKEKKEEIKKEESAKNEIRQEIKREEIQRKIAEKPVQKEHSATVSDFHQDIIDYFSQNKINVLEEKIIRKSSEIDFIVEVPSAVGSLRYYVKAKSKKSINDGDLSSVFIQSQTKRLPALFLSKGELTKKAKEMLESEFKGMRFNRV